MADTVQAMAEDLGWDIDEVARVANAFYAENSWGNLSLSVTYTPILEVEYTQSDCGDHDELDWYSGGYDADAEAFDVMAATASLDAGYDRDDYAFNMVVTPYCSGNSAAGTGYVSQPGAWLNLEATDYDPSFVHELGHNFGANHGSYVSSNTDAWSDDADAWYEYGNLYTPMGAGYVADGFYANHFTVEAKAIFDWVLVKDLAYVDPYADGVASCAPCAFSLHAADSGDRQGHKRGALQCHRLSSRVVRSQIT